MIGRIKLAIKIIFGYDIIVYEQNSKKIKAIINGDIEIMENNLDYDINKGKIYAENNGEMRYLKQ